MNGMIHKNVEHVTDLADGIFQLIVKFMINGRIVLIVMAAVSLMIKLWLARFWMQKLIPAIPNILKYRWAHDLCCKASHYRYIKGDYNV